MKKIYLLLSVCGLPLGLNAQLADTFSINTNIERQPISPYVYSTNGQSDDRPENITGRRIGGNRMTSYNWADNFSNGGADYINDNDNYMPYALGLPSADYLVPNIVLTAFHDTSLSMNCNSLITLPMCGYVSRDGNGVVTSSPPSSRWRQVVNRKGSAFVYPPDTASDSVFVDECLSNLINVFGNSNTSTGIKNYEMDNEWSIWNSSQPLLHPAQPTIAEAISKSTALAATIKIMDSAALVYGPVDYGYTSYLTFQNAPDWSSYSSTYSNFAYAYLASMKQKSDSVGRRLLDVYDVHYYSSAMGLDSHDSLEDVEDGGNDTGVAIARMESTRSLWDSSYVENSWIGEYYSPVAFIPALQHGINRYNPGTKLAFTEFSFGGENHISGGIAMADMLGIAGRFGVYWTSVWGPVNQYWGSGYKIFRNYDGNNSTFGDTHVYANTNDWSTSSVYSALQSTDTTIMNIIAMNKDYDSTLNAVFTITANTNFNKAQIYALTQADTLIHYIGSMAITGNHFNYAIPTLSVYHFVLSDTLVTAVNNIQNIYHLAVYPNPSTGLFTLTFSSPTDENLSIEVMDITGNVIETLTVKSSAGMARLNLTSLSDGVYMVRISGKNGCVMSKLVKG